VPQKKSVFMRRNHFPKFKRSIILTVFLSRGVLPENLGRGVRPASQNPYPIYDQNLRFSLPMT